MSETAVIVPGAECCDDEILGVAEQHTPNLEATIAFAEAAAAVAPALDRRILKRYDIHQPSPDAVVKEVHFNGLQPYQITRRLPRPDRPMNTISALPSGEVMAGTKAGRRESHIFVGNPSQGTTVWLPVVASDGAWNFNAIDRALCWRRMSTTTTTTTATKGNHEHHIPTDLELIDATTSEPLVEYHATETGAALYICSELEESCELLVLASILAITEPRRCAQKDIIRPESLVDPFLSHSSLPSSPETSPNPSPKRSCPFEHDLILSRDSVLTDKLAEFARKLSETSEEEWTARAVHHHHD